MTKISVFFLTLFSISCAQVGARSTSSESLSADSSNEDRWYEYILHSDNRDCTTGCPPDSQDIRSRLSYQIDIQNNGQDVTARNLNIEVFHIDRVENCPTVLLREFRKSEGRYQHLVEYSFGGQSSINYDEAEKKCWWNLASSHVRDRNHETSDDATGRNLILVKDDLAMDHQILFGFGRLQHMYSVRLADAITGSH